MTTNFHEMNFLLIAAGVLLLLLSTTIENKKKYKPWSLLLSIPGILIFVAGFGWHTVQKLIR